MGKNITTLVLDHDWIFPEVRQFLLAQCQSIPLQTQHRLTPLLIKYGWPSMLGGNRAWHIRELEQTVDKYLQETNGVEVVPFDENTKKAFLNSRRKRKTDYIVPYFTEPIVKEYYTPPVFQEISEIRDQSEAHYLISIKGIKYSSLRPKFEYELFYKLHREYTQLYEGHRRPTSLETIWPELLQLDERIIKRPVYFNSYSSLLDYVYEFEGRDLDRQIPEIREIITETGRTTVEQTGRVITRGEWRVRRIQGAIQEKRWLWALDHRKPVKWYPVRPLKISESGKTVRVITLDGRGHEKYLSLTNLYSRPAEDYYGKVC